VIVVLFSGLQTLFNFNPLIKLDGYYMLSDYLEVPNLRSKAFRTLWNWITRSPKRKAFREERAQLIYGACALVFSATLLVVVYTRIYTWATDNWATAGLVGFAVFATVTLRRTAVESISGLKTLVSYVAVRKYRNATIVLLALLISILGHWELKVRAEFRILAQSDAIVYAGTSGSVTEVLVRENVRVRKGDVLARMNDYEKQTEARKIAGDLEQRKNTLERLKAGATAEQIEQQEKRIEAKQAELDNVWRNQQARKELEESLEQRRVELRFLQEKAGAQKKLLDEELIAAIQYQETRSAADGKEREIAQAEAAIKAFNEKASRDADLLTKELAVYKSELAVLKAGTRPETIRETEAEVHKFESLLAALNQEIAKYEILAPIDGTVATPFPERKTGQRLVAGDEFLRLIDTAAVTAELLVPEKDMEDVKSENKVWLKARGLKDWFQGRVDEIGPVAITEDNQQVIPVRVRLENEDNALKPAMTGVAVIYCGPRRIIDVMTHRIRRWVKTDVLTLLP
jgi:multidrug efflux pump subunit AcrA (membrane-fusion protein)